MLWRKDQLYFMKQNQTAVTTMKLPGMGPHQYQKKLCQIFGRFIYEDGWFLPPSLWLIFFFVRGKMYISFWGGRMLRSYICFVTPLLFLSETSVAHLGGSGTSTSHPLFIAQLIPLQISVAQVPVLLYVSLSWELNKQNGSSLSQS